MYGIQLFHMSFSTRSSRLDLDVDSFGSKNLDHSSSNPSGVLVYPQSIVECIAECSNLVWKSCRAFLLNSVTSSSFESRHVCAGTHHTDGPINEGAETTDGNTKRGVGDAEERNGETTGGQQVDDETIHGETTPK